MEPQPAPICKLFDCYQADATDGRTIPPVHISSPQELADRLRALVASESRVVNVLMQDGSYLNVAIGGELAAIQVLPPPGGLVAVEALANNPQATNLRVFNHLGFDTDRPIERLMSSEEAIRLAVHIVSRREIPSTHTWIDSQGNPVAPGPWPIGDCLSADDIPF